MERRRFLQLSSFTAGAWLISGMSPFVLQAQAGEVSSDSFAPHKLIKMQPDGKVIIYVLKQEMGQQVNTALPALIAEELDVDPENVQVETLPYEAASAGSYNTYASASVRSSWFTLRKAGAAARMMLLEVAAAELRVSPQELITEKSKVINPKNGAFLHYKSLIEKASKLKVPENPTLKEIKDFKFIGKKIKRTNINNLLTGRHQYGMDIRLPEMTFAAVVRSPVFNGKIKSWDDSEVKKLGSGIIKIVPVYQMGDGIDNRNGLAIIALNTWLAFKAQKLIKIEWDFSDIQTTDSATIFESLKKVISSEQPTLTFNTKGKSTSFAKGTNTNAYKANYELPYLSHLAMEPVNCTAWYKNGSYQIWGGFQAPGVFNKLLTKAFNVDSSKIFVNLLPMGGAFGRKEKVDNAAEAMQLSAAIGKPVQVVFTREDDTRNGFYRPASYHELSAVVNKTFVSEWRHEVAIATFPAKNISSAQDIYGGAAADLCYPITDYQTAFYPVQSPIPIGSWRSISYNHNVFAVESFIDELAGYTKTDPVDFRMNLFATEASVNDVKLKHIQRLRNVLQKCAEGINWKKPPAPNHYRGIACCEYTHAESFVAHAFEISISVDKSIKIHKIVCAIDSGIIVDPDGFKAQQEGSLVWALSAVLKDNITFKKGQVEQQSFFDHEVIRMIEMPPFELIIIESNENPGGGGEPGVPSVAPALCNAIAAATGQRIRKLPLLNEGYTLQI